MAKVSHYEYSVVLDFLYKSSSYNGTPLRSDLLSAMLSSTPFFRFSKPSFTASLRRHVLSFLDPFPPAYLSPCLVQSRSMYPVPVFHFSHIALVRSYDDGMGDYEWDMPGREGARRRKRSHGGVFEAIVVALAVLWLAGREKRAGCD